MALQRNQRLRLKLRLVENNLLGGSEGAQYGWILQHCADIASCADAPGSASCQKAMNERDAVGLSLATDSVALLPGGAQACGGWEPALMQVSVI